jgi:hypothetical protein
VVVFAKTKEKNKMIIKNDTIMPHENPYFESHNGVLYKIGEKERKKAVINIVKSQG